MKTLRDLVVAHLFAVGLLWEVDLDLPLAEETGSEQGVVIRHGGERIELTVGTVLDPVFRHHTMTTAEATVYFGVGDSYDERDFTVLDDAISFAIHRLSLTLITRYQESPEYMQLQAETSLEQEL